MAHFFNSDDVHFSSSSSYTSGELNGQIYGTYADDWSIVGGSGPMVGSQTSFQATGGYESVAPPRPYMVPANGYDQPSYLENYWAEVDQPVFPSQDNSFASMAAYETSTAVQTPSSVPLDYWGSSQGGAFTSVPYMEDARDFHQPSTGPVRTEPIPMGRFQPYGMSSARPNEYWNAEAGPSTSLTAPFVPSVDLPIQQPSGWISETTADAETTQTITEEHEVPKPKRTRLPRGEGRQRDNRKRTQADANVLRHWLHRHLGLKKIPSVNEALRMAVDMIKFLRPAVYQEPQLRKGPIGGPVDDSRTARKERRKRGVERGCLQELSRYYELKPGQGLWERPPLLLKVLEDLDILHEFTTRLVLEDPPCELP